MLKGEVIKPGSIGLDAFNEELKTKFESSGGSYDDSKLRADIEETLKGYATTDALTTLEDKIETLEKDGISSDGILSDYLTKEEAGATYQPKGDYATKTYVDDKVALNGGGASASTTEEIIIAGGPLADDVNDNLPEGWIKDGNKVIPSGTSIQEILEVLFLKPEDGSVSWGAISWNPTLGKPTVELSSNGPVEVGSTVTCKVGTTDKISGNTRSATLTATYGYFETTTGAHINETTKVVSNKGSESGTLAVGYSWNGTALDDFTSNVTTLKIKPNDNTFTVSQSGFEVSVAALPTTTAYASTNTKKVIPSNSKTLTDSSSDEARTKSLTSTNSDTIKGYYRWFAFSSSSTDVSATSASWHFTTNKTISSVSVEDQKYIVILVPAGFTLTNATQMNVDFKPSLTTTDVELTIGGGTDKYQYKMYYWKNTSGSTATIDNINIS